MFSFSFKSFPFSVIIWVSCFMILFPNLAFSSICINVIQFAFFEALISCSIVCQNVNFLFIGSSSCGSYPLITLMFSCSILHCTTRISMSSLTACIKTGSKLLFIAVSKPPPNPGRFFSKI